MRGILPDVGDIESVLADYRTRQVGAGRLILELSSSSTRSVEHDPVFSGAGFFRTEADLRLRAWARSIVSAIKTKDMTDLREAAPTGRNKKIDFSFAVPRRDR